MSTYNTNTERLLDAIKTNTANITITADSLSIDTDVLEGKVDGTTAAIQSGLQAMQSAHVATDPGTPIVGVRNDDLADLAGADHDYAPIQLTSLGAIYTYESNARALVSDNSGENRSSLSNGANTDAITVDIKGRQIVAGGDLENAAATAAPVQIGGRYDSSNRTLGNGDVGGLALNVRGEAKVEVTGGTSDTLLTAIDTVLDTIKVDTEAIETAVEAIQVDAAAIETLLTAANVDHAANEALLTTIDADTGAMVTDLAALEVLSTAANVDLAAMEVLLTAMDADTNAIKTDIAALEVLSTAANVDLAAMEVLLTAANVDHAANEVLLTGIDADTNAIKTAVEIIDNAISGSEMQVDVVAALPAGSNAIGKLAANSGVDIGDVDVTSIVPGTGATNLGKAEDAAHTSGDVGVMPLAVRNDALATLGGADGDYAPLQVDATGSLYTNNQFGTFGSILVTGTTAVTCGVADRVFVAIYMLTNTVFNSASGGLVAETEQLYLDDTGAGTSIDADGGAAIDGITFPAGMTLYGRYTGFTLVSGSVVAYVG